MNVDTSPEAIKAAMADPNGARMLALLSALAAERDALTKEWCDINTGVALAATTADLSAARAEVARLRDVVTETLFQLPSMRADSGPFAARTIDALERMLGAALAQKEGGE